MTMTVITFPKALDKAAAYSKRHLLLGNGSRSISLMPPQPKSGASA
jgi:hypothetical protein